MLPNGRSAAPRRRRVHPGGDVFFHLLVDVKLQFCGELRSAPAAEQGGAPPMIRLGLPRYVVRTTRLIAPESLAQVASLEALRPAGVSA